MATDVLDSNLIRTTKQGGQKGGDQKLDMAGGRVASQKKKILKLLAYAVLFLWSLVTFTFLKIPDAVVANFLLNALNTNTPYQWQADKIGIGFFPGPHLNMEKLALEPKIPGTGMVPMAVDTIRIYPNPFALIPIGGAPAVGGSFRAEAYKALIKGSFGVGRDLSFSLSNDGAELSKIPPLTALFEKGKVTDLLFQIYLPNQHAASAEGELHLKAKDVQFDPSTLGLPVVLPILSLGDVDIQGTVTKGILKFEKFKIGSAGKDLEVSIPTGTITLSDVSLNTRYDLHLLIKPSANILKAVPGLGDALGMAATLKPEGYAMHLQGSLGIPGFPTKD